MRIINVNQSGEWTLYARIDSSVMNLRICYYVLWILRIAEFVCVCVYERRRTVDGKKLTGEEIPLLGLAAGEGMSRFPNTLGRLPTTRLSTRGICMQMARVTIETRGLSLLGSNYPSVLGLIALISR